MEERKTGRILTATASIALSTIGLSGLAMGAFVYSQYQDCLEPVAKIRIAKKLKISGNSYAFRDTTYSLSKVSVQEISIRKVSSTAHLAKRTSPQYEYGESTSPEREIFYYLQNRVEVVFQGEPSKFENLAQFKKQRRIEAVKEQAVLEDQTPTVLVTSGIRKPLKEKPLQNEVASAAVKISAIHKKSFEKKKFEPKEPKSIQALNIKNTQNHSANSMDTHKEEGVSNDDNAPAQFYSTLMDSGGEKENGEYPDTGNSLNPDQGSVEVYSNSAQNSVTSEENALSNEIKIYLDSQNTQAIQTIYAAYSAQGIGKTPDYSIKDYVNMPARSADAGSRVASNESQKTTATPSERSAYDDNANAALKKLSQKLVAAKNESPDQIEEEDEETNLTVEKQTVAQVKVSGVEKPMAAFNENALKKLASGGPKFKGRVVEAFTQGRRPVADAKVLILGSNVETKTNADGVFEFANVDVDGLLPLWVEKDKYFGRGTTIFQTEDMSKNEIELASEEIIGKAAGKIDKDQNRKDGWIFGELEDNARGNLANHRVDLFGAKEAKVYYLDDAGKIDVSRTMTGRRGQFVVFNINPGTYLVAITAHDGTEKAPHIMQVNGHEGIVEKLSLGQRVSINGTIKNAASKNLSVAGASVQLLGSSKVVKSDKTGKFIIDGIYVNCDALNYLQVDQPGFYRNRTDFSCMNKTPELGIYPSAHVDSLSKEAEYPLAATEGVVIGRASYPKSVKVQLIGAEEIEMKSQLRGYDFYFSKEGLLNPNRNRTSENGEFVVMNAPEGLSYVQVVDKNGVALSYWPIYTSASTVNVYKQ